MGLFYFSDLQEIAGVSADTAVMEKEKEKTQLMLIALTSKYKLKDIILGTATAILVLNGLAALAGGLVSEFIPGWLIKMIAALAFCHNIWCE